MRSLKVALLLSIIGLTVTALDEPYYCGVSILCGESCLEASVSCEVSGTVGYPTFCEYNIVEYLSAECIVRAYGSGVIISSTVSSCHGCDSGPGSNKCEPGSGAWWVGCDPLAT